jgi:hypothetical protein
VWKVQPLNFETLSAVIVFVTADHVAPDGDSRQYERARIPVDDEDGWTLRRALDLSPRNRPTCGSGRDGRSLAVALTGRGGECFRASDAVCGTG